LTIASPGTMKLALAQSFEGEVAAESKNGDLPADLTASLGTNDFFVDTAGDEHVRRMFKKPKHKPKAVDVDTAGDQHPS